MELGTWNSELGTSYELGKETIPGLENFVCKLYLPKKNISDVGEVQKLLFRIQKSYSECLPPTKTALIQGILRLPMSRLERHAKLTIISISRQIWVVEEK